jgi:hypothetical protein
VSSDFVERHGSSDPCPTADEHSRWACAGIAASSRASASALALIVLTAQRSACSKLSAAFRNDGLGMALKLCRTVDTVRVSPS